MILMNGYLALNVCARFIPSMEIDDIKGITYSLSTLTLTPQISESHEEAIPLVVGMPLDEVLVLDPLPPLPNLPFANPGVGLRERFNHSAPLSVLANQLCTLVDRDPVDPNLLKAFRMLAHQAQTLIIGQDFHWLVADPVERIAQMTPTLSLTVRFITLNQGSTEPPAFHNIDPLIRPDTFPSLQVRLDAIINPITLDETLAQDTINAVNLMHVPHTKTVADFRTAMRLGKNCHIIVSDPAERVAAMKATWGQSPPCGRRMFS